MNAKRQPLCGRRRSLANSRRAVCREFLIRLTISYSCNGETTPARIRRPARRASQTYLLPRRASACSLIHAGCASTTVLRSSRQLRKSFTASGSARSAAHVSVQTPPNTQAVKNTLNVTWLIGRLKSNSRNSSTNITASLHCIGKMMLPTLHKQMTTSSAFLCT
jgi:hypothetical protein